ncbi:hypothetical protein L7F22_036046 [Adiantum nelumboides]|nr:hypothetical protein [Adiantum nelumboides]
MLFLLSDFPISKSSALYLGQHVHASLSVEPSFTADDVVEVNSRKASLIGKREPYVFLYEGLCDDESSSPVIKKTAMGILACMEKLDCKVRQDVIDFSRYGLMGNNTDALKVLDSIKDETTLKKIVRYCTKQNLHNFAARCFANMGRAYAVSAINTLKDQVSNKNKKTTAAAVAIQLGCVADAEKEYIECKRYDLLIDLYQTCGFWEKSIEIALKYDHVNLKNVHHSYAKHLEAVGDIQMAIHQYELSNTHRYEVPRMLYSLGKVDDLKNYVDDKKDPSLHRWWANYCEAKSMLHNAIDHYKLAGEVASVVRVHCLIGDLETAENIVTETSDPSATFHLGQQYEKLGNIARAMQLFAKAGRSDCAANLAMKHEIDKELLSLALQGTKNTMLSSAKYFEEKGCCEEAVLLYEKGGDIEKAVDVCVHFQLFDTLRAIADNLNEETDPSILVRCGDFLLSHKQYEKATLLLIAAGQHRRAFELCIHEDVQITDKMMELFSKQISEENPEDSKQLLAALAEFCDSQGSYHLACRIYTQAGDKLSAMKALMKSGDTEKVLIYANVSRQKQLYVLAAGYLQTLNWHHDASIMKKIVQMYTKAGEMELLSSFYEACAQVEIDGFRDYEKALGAMKEAWKFLSKLQSPRRNGKIQSLKIRIEEVERFVQTLLFCKSTINMVLLDILLCGILDCFAGAGDYSSVLMLVHHDLQPMLAFNDPDASESSRENAPIQSSEIDGAYLEAVEDLHRLAATQSLPSAADNSTDNTKKVPSAEQLLKSTYQQVSLYDLLCMDSQFRSDTLAIIQSLYPGPPLSGGHLPVHPMTNYVVSFPTTPLTDYKSPRLTVSILGQQFTGVIVDGGSGINLMPEFTMLALGLKVTRPAPFTVTLAYQRTVLPLGVVEQVPLQVQNFTFKLDFVVVRLPQVEANTKCS